MKQCALLPKVAHVRSALFRVRGHKEGLILNRACAALMQRDRSNKQDSPDTLSVQTLLKLFVLEPVQTELRLRPAKAS